MPADPPPFVTGTLAEAFLRYRIMTSFAERERDHALHDPMATRNQELGLVSAPATPDEARAELNQRFDDLLGHLAANTIVELCAAFEQQVKSRLPGVLAELEGRLRGADARTHRVEWGPLIRKPNELKSLDSLVPLFAAAETTTGQRLEELRRRRNAFAHGARPALPDARDVTEAYELLTTVLASAFPP